MCPVLGTAPLATPRTSDEAARDSIAIPKETRHTLRRDKLASYEKDATRPIKGGQFTQLNLLDPKNSADIAQCCKLGIKVNYLAEDLETFDMLHVFQVPTNWYELTHPQTDDPFAPDPTEPGLVNIVKEGIAHVSLDDVKHASAYYYYYGSGTYFIQNLTWSNTKILDSCDLVTRSKLTENLKSLRLEHQTGPVALYLLLKMITATEDRTVQAMLDSYRHLKLSKDFAGEDVQLCTTYIRGFHTWITSVTDQIPIDFLSCTMEILSHASNEEFHNSVTAIRHNHDEKVKCYNLEEFLYKVEQLYAEQSRLNKWIAAKPATVFTAETRTCYRCGQPGHLANDPRCPQFNSNSRGGRGGRGGRRSFPRPGGGGTGGRGGNNSPTKPEYMPPGKDEPHEKTLRSGVKAKWCGKCEKIENGRFFRGVWVHEPRAHTSEEHTEQNALVVPQEAKEKAKAKRGQSRKPKGTTSAQPKSANKATSTTTRTPNRALTWNHVMENPQATQPVPSSFHAMQYAGV